MHHLHISRSGIRPLNPCKSKTFANTDFILHACTQQLMSDSKKVQTSSILGPWKNNAYQFYSLAKNLKWLLKLKRKFHPDGRPPDYIVMLQGFIDGILFWRIEMLHILMVGIVIIIATFTQKGESHSTECFHISSHGVLVNFKLH